MNLSCSLEKAARTCNSDRLVHHPLANPEVLVNPFGNVLVLAGNLVRFETGSGNSQNGFESDELEG